MKDTTPPREWPLQCDEFVLKGNTLINCPDLAVGKFEEYDEDLDENQERALCSEHCPSSFPGSKYYKEPFNHRVGDIWDTIKKASNEPAL